MPEVYTLRGTGLYYYGARYYEPRTSVWLSVDPLAEKYSNSGSYVYCYENPVLYIDPNGMGVGEWYSRNSFRVQKSVELGLNTLGATASAACAAVPGGQGLAIIGVAYFSDKIATNVSEIINNKPQQTLVQQGLTKVGTAAGLSDDNAKTAAGYVDTGIELAVGVASAKTILNQAKNPLLTQAPNQVTRAISRVKTPKVLGNMSAFFESALQQSKNGMSNVGRALQKHAGRAGSVFENIKFTGKTATQDGMNVLKDIFNSNKQLIDEELNGTKTIYDKVSGRGVNISREGNFNGFRELPQRVETNVKKVLKDD